MEKTLLIDQKKQQIAKIMPNVSRETLDCLLGFEAMVLKWQTHINLIAKSTIAAIWQRHILDSAQLFQLKAQATQWLDLGSGGGFPGIVIAIFLKQQQNGFINLVESNSKKAAFLRTVITEFCLPAKVYCQRIETIYDAIACPQVITARALASLNKLFFLCQPWFKQNAIGLLPKGRGYCAEVEEAHANWLFRLQKHQSVIDEDSVILEVTNLHQNLGKDFVK